MKRQSDRAFGLTFAAVFALVFTVSWLAFDARLDWAAWTAAAFAAVALAAPRALQPLNRAWAAFAHRLAIVNNYLLLGLFFYALMTPLAVALRLFGWDPMYRAPDRGSASYWTPVARNTTRETMGDMF